MAMENKGEYWWWRNSTAALEKNGRKSDKTE
ncbi:hypothetical protein T4B_8358 [Trichinella pseudospiralis]|uniref:Uncharacterized protein n=1 Tax=Trichinella pseudospiralis TaxID=6337 RepID=A0A0V1DQK3_TRIPS|nr:hypothetical protein T4A_13939 [Trichinella pseudospiralis]KRY95581.1 hypothetical protein T4B_8358 [Trichinella pseudospiralis]